MNIFKSLVLKAVNSMGYGVYKIGNKTDIDLYYSLFSKEDVDSKNFFNIGAGTFKHLAWTNVDYYSDWYKDNIIGISYDLFKQKPLPIEDCSANVVYSSHTIEHISDEAAQNMFNEAYRVLKVGGIIRITTPDIDLCYRSVTNNDRYFWKEMIKSYSMSKEMSNSNISKPMKDVSLKQIFLFNFASQMSELTNEENPRKIDDAEIDRIFTEMPFQEALNHIKDMCSLELQKKYTVNHINWWNGDKLVRMLRVAGFNDVYLSGHGQSALPILRNTVIFDNTCPYLSIYVEARK